MAIIPGLSVAHGEDLAAVIANVQKRYASVQSVAGDFRQTYRAPGIDQTESGAFWMKRPGLMRWEYRQPEEKLFLADGRDVYLYVPADRQVTVQDFRASDIRRTPLGFLLGAEDIAGRYQVSKETEFGPVLKQTMVVRLLPRKHDEAFAFLVLELDRATHEIRRVLLREHTGNTSEFLISNVSTNIKVPDGRFRFKPPQGAEVLRLSHSD